MCNAATDFACVGHVPHRGGQGVYPGGVVGMVALLMGWCRGRRSRWLTGWHARMRLGRLVIGWRSAGLDGDGVR